MGINLKMLKNEITFNKKFKSKIYYINVILNIIINAVISCVIQAKSKTLLKSDVSSKSRFWWGFRLSGDQNRRLSIIR